MGAQRKFALDDCFSEDERIFSSSFDIAEQKNPETDFAIRKIDNEIEILEMALGETDQLDLGIRLEKSEKELRTKIVDLNMEKYELMPDPTKVLLFGRKVNEIDEINKRGNKDEAQHATINDLLVYTFGFVPENLCHDMQIAIDRMKKLYPWITE